ncbi:elongation factor 2 kinase, putative [Entamoeba invadens IP1]|uniref:Elongation factor 2 kinase, putative n=1 Tax=Entamoeba invadens IP1 TaxID=370355 RepID=A0A0A1UBI1_ENTIV|nr:elongation factor 2 kinase, putative [Entamoeba invadens IP1]ELP92474.1 elongation factor 2 kinase, putative [Entamoeba invadens IP1]|eukprot:XP_004259245.1 elongation factor 2 kinase, putative [Entamoeba invadens IP1]
MDETKTMKYNVQAEGYHIEIPYTSDQVRELLREGKSIEYFQLHSAKVIAKSASFGNGGERTAFSGKFSHSDREIVLKRFNKIRSFECYIETVERQMLCESFAEEYNQLRVTPLQLHFVPLTLFLAINTRDTRYDGVTLSRAQLRSLGENFFFVEPLLSGEFLKFNSNNGDVWIDTFHASLHAFSHWTWVVSNHQLLVADLQGVFQDKWFYLTDPAVLSSTDDEFKYSPTNLGEEGIQRFFKTHRCNQVCIGLGISKNVHDVQTPEEFVVSNTPTKFLRKSAVKNLEIDEFCGTTQLTREKGEKKLKCEKSEFGTTNECLETFEEVQELVDNSENAENEDFYNYKGKLETLGRCVVLYPFRAEHSDELNLRRDDVVDILAKEGDWWWGKCNGREGTFPKNHVQELLQMFRFVCCMDYEAKCRDEVSVKAGQFVYLVGRKKDLVRVTTEGMKCGFLPFDVVKIVS